jgi:hypothetical protein
MRKSNVTNERFEEDVKRIFRSLRNQDFQAPPCLGIPFERFTLEEMKQWRDPSRVQMAMESLLEMAPCLYTYLRLAPEDGSVGITRFFDKGDPEGCILSIDPVPRWYKYLHHRSW